MLARCGRWNQDHPRREAPLRSPPVTRSAPSAAPLPAAGVHTPSCKAPPCCPLTPCAAAAGAGGATSYAALQRADAAWRALRTRTAWGPRPTFVRECREPLGAAPQYDVVVCGGTLGVFLACSLQLQGGLGRAAHPCARCVPAFWGRRDSWQRSC